MARTLVHCTLILFALWSTPVCAHGATVLFGFETDADLKLWHYEGSPDTTPREVSLAPGFATSGAQSLVFSFPQWKPGLAEWPAFECQPPVTDWSAYDRLVYDVTNPGPDAQQVCILISDSQHATRDGLLCETRLAPFAHVQQVVPIAHLQGKGLDPADIRVMHVFTERPAGEMALHLDNFVLLKPGEPLPTPSAEYLQAFAKTQATDLAALHKSFADAGQALSASLADAPELRAWADARMADVNKRLHDYEAMIRQAGPAVLTAGDQHSALVAQLEGLQREVAVRIEFETIRAQVQTDATAAKDLVVGFASSMEKVLPRAGAPHITLASRTELSLARYEKESFQVIVMPCGADVKQVGLQIGDLHSAEGMTLPASNIDSAVVGYVRTSSIPPYGSSHVGWWPDPILEFQREADIAAGDAQAFWVRVRCPQDQAAGVYSGKLSVLVQGKPAFTFDLAVRVHGFAVPARTPLDLAVTFQPMYYEPNGTGGWQEGGYRFTEWQKHRLEWGDMLADYYLSYDSLYHRQQPDWDVLDRIHKQGRLGRFNLGYYGACGASEEEIATWKASTLPRIRLGYEAAKERGLLNHAYIYGCDENPQELFPAVERAASILKQEFPGVTVLTTTYDNTYGEGSAIKSMDAFCPLTPSFDPAGVVLARQQGKQVWWYTCCGPHHPHLNTFIEYPAIAGRLLMGAMTAKYRPDGYLYYQISIWNSQPITQGPFTDFDPRSWTTYNGDGSWTCPGPDGTPLPTVRLENFRDGLEDYAYLRTLEATIAKVETSDELRAGHGDWLARAKGLLEVPADVLASKTEYTDDPAALYRWREAVARAIEDAGTEPAYPW